MKECDSILGATYEAQIDSLGRCVDSIQRHLDALQTKMDLVSNIIETSNDSISNQLTAASILIGVIGIVITIMGIVLGYYISRKKEQIERIEKAIDEKRANVEEIAKTTKELDEKIHNNLSALYQNLRKEENKTFLERLIKEPKDIDNLGEILLARELDSENYALLKEAYLKLRINENDERKQSFDDEESPKESYLLQFFQHFTCQSILDDVIRPDFVDGFRSVFECAFESDIIRNTNDICKALADPIATFNKEEVLVDFLKAINQSKFKSFASIKNILEQNITPNKLLQDAIMRCETEGVSLLLFTESAPKET